MDNKNLTHEQELMIGFLVKAAIPKKYKNSNNESDRLKDAIWRAHRDVLTGRKNVTSYSNQVAEFDKGILNDLYDMCSNTECSLQSENLIEELSNTYKDNSVTYGAIQKLVNMTLKYLIILKELEGATVPDVERTACDCPLDSQILGSINKHRNVHWTKINDKETYNKIQQCILDQLNQDTPFGKLTYDFYHWGENK